MLRKVFNTRTLNRRAVEVAEFGIRVECLDFITQSWRHFLEANFQHIQNVVPECLYVSFLPTFLVKFLGECHCGLFESWRLN